MELKDWIIKYEKKTEKFSIPQGFVLYFEPDKGFFLYAKIGESFEIDATCTNDIHYFAAVANRMAKQRSCQFVRTQTFHDPAAYMRLTKADINISLSGVRSNNRMYWVFEKKVV